MSGLGKDNLATPVDETRKQETSPERRARVLTEKGTELYLSSRNKHLVQLDKLALKIEVLAVKLPQYSESSEKNALLKDLQLTYKCYQNLSTEYRDFLNRTKTLQSVDDLIEFSLREGKYTQIAEDCLAHFRSIEDVSVSGKSVKSHGSRSSRASEVSGSHASRISATAVIKRAIADAARARLNYAEKEADLQKQKAVLVEKEDLSKANAVRQKAEIDTELQLLSIKKEVAAAEAEAKALESVEGDNVSSRHSLFHQVGSSKAFDPRERTQQYVKEQIDIKMNSALELSKGDIITSKEEAITHQIPSHNIPAELPFSQKQVNLSANAPVFQPNPAKEARIPIDPPDISHYIYPPPRPQNINCTYPPQTGNSTMANDLTKFLLKKDLLLSRLSYFTDHPESYAVWKTSFKGIVEELGCTPVEELDLLVKWLGPESKKYAMSIRTSNANCPSRGLQRIWERLDERYGCPEMVEAALKNKLANFPKLTQKDSQRLYDLADILSEVESAMENTVYQSLLAYYNTSSGIIPIVAKLPHQLQDKWTSKAVNYKNQHKVSFPPFSVFAQFIREMSKIKNDPGFIYELPSENQTKKSGAPNAHRHRSEFQNQRPLVAARKTELDQTSVPTVASPELCPLHKTKHSLNKCKAFKAKPLEERRKFLKDNRICFKCCDSDQHIRRNCKATVKCEVCGQNHPTALHLTTPNQDKSPVSLPSEVHGGEGNKPNHTAAGVATKYTEICGSEFHGKSCAKNILVRVYPESHPERVQKMYAIIDDQSNRSLVESC